MTIKGTIFNIQRYTVHDGPGIRTELFFKGCPLNCKWCSNPEGKSRKLQPGVYSTKCIGTDKCGLCVTTCPDKGAIMLYREDRKIVSIDRKACRGCMKCTEFCPADALKPWGKYYTVDEIMDTVRKDKGFYSSSGGGVTFSGGEPFMQPDFLEEILKDCKSESIHTCVETTLHADMEIIKPMLPYIDLFITDIKHMYDDSHKKYTGAGNKRILENIRTLVTGGQRPIIRIPIIPGVNDDTRNMTHTADFILNELDNRIQHLQLLRFMRLGEEKYRSLGMPYEMGYLDIDQKQFNEHMKELKRFFNEKGIKTI